MIVLGIETSCDETGVAIYDTGKGLLAHTLHSQVALHDEYGGVVPELASRDHVRRLLPLIRDTARQSGVTLGDIDAVAYTEGPGLAGALMVGAGVASALAMGLGIPAIGIHHLEGHLLSPLLSADPPQFPFVALLVSGGHTQLMRVTGVGDYTLLGETLDDAAGEAFDKTAKLLGLPYPGGPALAALAELGVPGRFRFPRPMLPQLDKRGDLDFSFSGLKTAVMLVCEQRRGRGLLDEQSRHDIAAEFQQAVVEVLTAKSMAALRSTGLNTLVVAGGVGANRMLRSTLDRVGGAAGFRICYPEMALCTDNGAMIAFAGALRMQGRRSTGNTGYAFSVKPRWDLSDMQAEMRA